MGESFMQSAISAAEIALLKRFPSSLVSYQAHPNYVSYTVTLLPNSQSQREECENYLHNHFSPAVEKAFGENILYCEDKKVASYLISKLLEKKLSISFAETSCAGFLSKEISVVSHNPSFFAGAVVATSDDIKRSILKLPENVIQLGEADPEKLSSHLSVCAIREMHSDIALAEYGFPIDPFHKQNNQAGFYLSLSIKNKCFYDLNEVEKISTFFMEKSSIIWK